MDLNVQKRRGLLCDMPPSVIQVDVLKHAQNNFQEKTFMLAPLAFGKITFNYKVLLFSVTIFWIRQ